MEYYNETIAPAKNVEMIYFNRDSSEKAMEAFMAKFKMPWPALDFDKKDRFDLAKDLAGNGVPNYVLVDANGEVLAKGAGGTKSKIAELAKKG